MPAMRFAIRIMLAAGALLAAPVHAQKQPDPKIIQEIYDCLAVGLPAKWKKAWVVVTEVGESGTERQFEGKFFYALSAADKTGAPLLTCSAQQVAKGVVSLSANLPAEQRRWKGVTLTYTSDGKFNLAYDYGQ
jgi:hypothetical protein